MNAKFQIGDKVKAIALPNAFPKPRPEIPNLTVESVRLVLEPHPYYRMNTVYSNGFQAVEGAEHFFELE